MFIAYPKIHRLGKDEVDGILDHHVVIQEKIDGANTSIWKEDGELHCGSRTQEKTEGFMGFVDYVKGNFQIQRLLTDHPEYRLFGEWLVRHTIAYNELSYKKFYLYDIMVDNKFIDPEEVQAIAVKYEIPHPQTFGGGKFTQDQIMEFVGKTTLGDRGEGVVIKSKDFINQYGDNAYAKIVSQSFKEDNAITFGGNNKSSETYNEMYVVNKYATMARVEKIINKIQPTLDKKLDLEHCPMIAGACYHDMLTEEIWDIQKKVSFINFRSLKGLASKKFLQIYKDILGGTPSIADTKE